MLRKLKSLAYLLIILFISIPCASAGEVEIQSACRSATQALIKKLEDRGLDKIGKVPTKVIKEKLARTKWIASPVFVLGSGGERLGGVNRVEENLVILSITTVANMKNGNIDSSGLNAFVLHEALGALGIDDEDYRVSLAIFYLGYRNDVLTDDPNLPNTLRNIIANAKTFTQNREYKMVDDSIAKHSGGGTSVGGGGDIVTVDIKTRLIERAFKKHSLDARTLDLFLNFKVQVYYTAQERFKLSKNALELDESIWAGAAREEILKQIEAQLR